MANKFMYIPNYNTQNFPSVEKNKFEHATNEPTNQNLKKVPKVVKPTNKKTL